MAAPVATPEAFHFQDDGIFPNSPFPLLVYRQVFSGAKEEIAVGMQQQFALNSWTNTWRWGVYPFHHYHSNTHEVLGVLSGTASLLPGGEKGTELEVQTGDVLVIPAGVAHKSLHQSNDFEVPGAYPNGLGPDLNRGNKGERPATDQNIAAVAVPAADPVRDKSGGILDRWKK